jgi:ring-1,2-phenylacetyl-CoA epoxidase subunit PaaC
MLQQSISNLISEDQQIQYLLHLADNALILSHRNSQWCGHGPILEQDIALTNIALDQLGQARNLYQYAALLITEKTGIPTTEDQLAYLRDVGEFKNCLIAELPNGDWGQTVLRNFLMGSYQFFLYQELQQIATGQLKAIADKSIKEITYHVRWSADWVVRLGDGTTESHTRMVQALELLWSYTGEMLEPNDYEQELIGSQSTYIKAAWEAKIAAVLAEANLDHPKNDWMQSGGKKGIHTEHLGYLLAEMQFLQRAYPGLEW